MKTKLLIAFVTVLLSSTAAIARPRPALPPVPEFTLNHWRFDQTNWWSAPRLAPSEMVNLSLVESWSGYAARLSPGGGVLRLPAVNSAGKINLALEEGSVRFWFAPDWSSASRGGTGPGAWGRLLDVGVWSADASHGWWSLYLDPSGSNLLFSVQADGVGEDYLAAPVAWRAGEWHQVTLTYGPKFTALHLDGELAAAGPAISVVPSAKVFVDTGFTVGSDTAGGNPARGTFDELATFGSPLAGDYVQNNYQWAAPQAALGPITAEEEEGWREWSAKLKAARELEAESGGGMMMMLLSGGCAELKLTASLLTNSNVQIDICGKELNARYDLITTTNLNPTISWQWLEEVPYPTNTLIVSTNTEYRFFQLKKVPDLDGDGQRDYWEWGGSVPGGIVIDDDRDNDGIPDSIETTAGSATNDPASLPPPSLYVSTTGPLSGADGSGDLPFRDLQTALNAATNYSVVLVKAGIYSGVSNRNLSFGGKRLVLASEKGWEATSINCGGGSNYAFAFTSAAEDYRAQVVGLTIYNGGSTARPAVTFAGGSAPTFVNCEFRNNISGAVGVTSAAPVFVNCRFRTNQSPFGGFKDGSVIYAIGASALARLSHCLLADNDRFTNGGQIYVTGGATVALNNTIVWSAGAATNAGPEIVTSGGTVSATYCNVRDGYAGEGNISSDPLFETNGNGRLTSTSPCIDQGMSDGLPGFGLFTRYDMDGEARLDHFDFANAAGTTDIGADEFVYRLQFPTGTGVSVVDEASGVSFLGTNSIGPVVAVVNDEARTGFHTFQLNSNATMLVNAYSNNVASEVNDLEGVTFDRATTNVYLITSQTKRNRYRDVDSSPPIAEPVVDPPSSDYDPRRTKLVRVRMNANLTNVNLITRIVSGSESNDVPASVGYEATNGLAAYIQQALVTNAALGDRTVTNRVLIARNTANKFGTPVNGVTYASGANLPYKDGGSSLTAGVSMGEFNGTSGMLTNSGLTSNTWYHYKIWAVDENTNYSTTPLVSDARLNGVPKLFINEFMASPSVSNDWIEFFNPAFVPVNMGGLRVADNAQLFYSIPAGTNIQARGHLRFFAVNGMSNGLFFPFSLNASAAGDRLTLRSPDGTVTIDDYQFGDQSTGVSEGRAWDGGPFGFRGIGQTAEGAKYILGSSYPPTEQADNHPTKHKFFRASPSVLGTTSYLEWGDMGALPPVWSYSPKQHDFHSVNVEDIAFRSTNEMILGLRSPLSNRTNGNAYYFVVTNVTAFTQNGGWNGLPTGITGPFEMNLDGLGIRSIKWCPDGLTNSAGQAVQRYLIVAGLANGGPLIREKPGVKSSLYSWTGDINTAPVKLINNLAGYAVRPEGIDIMRVANEWRVLFVEDRYLATGYGTRNAIHWPVTIIGPVP